MFPEPSDHFDEYNIIIAEKCENKAEFNNNWNHPQTNVSYLKSQRSDSLSVFISRQVSVFQSET